MALSESAARMKAYVATLPIQRGESEFVYFVRGELTGLIKIGIARVAAQRLAALQCGSPDRLVMVGVIHHPEPKKLEDELHHKFCAHRRHGEWFEPHADVLFYIAKNSRSVAEDERQKRDAQLQEWRGRELIAEPTAEPAVKGRGAKLARYLAKRGLSK